MWYIGRSSSIVRGILTYSCYICRGVASFPEDLNKVLVLGKGKVDLTIGSALDCFGGSICYDDVVRWHKEQNGGND